MCCCCYFLIKIKALSASSTKCLADNWVTCACGQLCRNLPRGLGKKPKDKKLSDLGMQFSRILYEINLEPSNEARKEAIEILKAIETRTTTLLKKLQII